MAKFNGAGVLPWSITPEGEYVVLLGQELSNKKRNPGTWSGFGGKKNPNETPEECAAREYNEETMGLLYTKKEILNIITDKNHPYYTTKNIIGNYVEFFIYVPYDRKLPKRFKEVRDLFLPLLGGHDPCMEKQQILWFPYENIMDHIISGNNKPYQFAYYFINGYMRYKIKLRDLMIKKTKR